MEIFLGEVQKVINNQPRDHGVIILSAIDGMGKSKLMRAMKSRASHVGFRYTQCYIWHTILYMAICTIYGYIPYIMKRLKSKYRIYPYKGRVHINTWA